MFRWDNGETREAIVESVEEGERIVLRFDDDGVVDLRVVATDGGSLVEVRESAPSWSTAIEFMGSSVGVRLQTDLHSDSACAIR